MGKKGGRERMAGKQGKDWQVKGGGGWVRMNEGTEVTQRHLPYVGSTIFVSVYFSLFSTLCQLCSTGILRLQCVLQHTVHGANPRVSDAVDVFLLCSEVLLMLLFSGLSAEIQ
jgi:hypothetical protein